METCDLLHETVSHGNVLLPFMEYDIISDKTKEERIHCHWHEEIEMLLLVKGRAQLSAGERMYAMEEGDFALIASNQLHAMSAPTGVEVEFLSFDFSPEFLYSFGNDILQQQYFEPLRKGKIIFVEFFHVDCGWKKEIREALWKMHEIFQNKSTGYELFLKAKLYEIFALLFAYAIVAKEERHSDRRGEQTRKVMQYLQENYERSISIEELSEVFHLSAGHLCRLFKEITGHSIVDYLNDYRIRISAQLLRESGLDIGEIAGRVGFNNISYFNKRFRQYMHMTPGEYRKNR